MMPKVVSGCINSPKLIGGDARGYRAETPVDTEQTVVTSAEQLSNFLPPMPGLQCNDSRGGNKYGNATDKIYNTSIPIHVEYVYLLFVNSVFVFS